MQTPASLLGITARIPTRAVPHIRFQMNAVVDPLEIARTLAGRFAETAAEHDRAGTFAHSNIAALRESGLTALTVPRRLGGAGAGLERAAQVVRLIGEGDPSTALVLAMQYLQHGLIHGGRWPGTVSDALGRAAVELGALINALRVEPELGTPARGGLPETVARRTSTGWKVDGRKIYSTGSAALAYGVVFVRTDEPEPRIGNVLVPMDAAGMRIEENWDHLGLRASGSHDVVLDAVAIPEDHAVDLRPPEGWRTPDTLQQAWSCALLAALYEGVARAAQNWFGRFLTTREPGSLGAPLSSLPRFHEAFGENERLLCVATRLTADLAAEVDRGRPPAPRESGFVKITATENAIAVVERCVKLTGNHALSRKNPLERHLRDVLCARIHWPQADAVQTAAGRIALEGFARNPA